MQGLRAEHQVHVGRALDDRLALLAGHAAADADHQVRLGLLQRFQRPSWLNTFSCAFSRMEQVLTRITSASSARPRSVSHAIARGEHVGHLRRVVLVHLATVGLDEQRPGY
jgi:hypothetical protein